MQSTYLLQSSTEHNKTKSLIKTNIPIQSAYLLTPKYTTTFKQTAILSPMSAVTQNVQMKTTTSFLRKLQTRPVTSKGKKKVLSLFAYIQFQHRILSGLQNSTNSNQGLRPVLNIITEYPLPFGLYPYAREKLPSLHFTAANIHIPQIKRTKYITRLPKIPCWNPLLSQLHHSKTIRWRKFKSNPCLGNLIAF